ncbi:lysostaphin resistance A-like protein [Embleya sp. NPDC127516]|uniref:CPBP family intramembrane glutamic endopeptidase n=1 Tax=Embleya sp. NPDC127516 TaxID=3363990 RepID=UPI0037F45D73
MTISPGSTPNPRDIHGSSTASTTALGGGPHGTASPPPLPQYSIAAVLTVWAAAVVPMALLAWVVTPMVAGDDASKGRFATVLIAALTCGLVWQTILVLGLVAREQASLRWSVLRDALWLRAPSDDRGRRGGGLWWWVAVFALGFLLVQLVPTGLSEPSDRSLGAFLESTEGQDYVSGAWGWLALVAVMMTFNSVLGEELLFRGLLLPRMRGAFGRHDWWVNGLLTGLYHVHQPWSMPGAAVAGGLFAYPSKRFRSAWMGIAIHSIQNVVLIVLILALVVR